MIVLPSELHKAKGSLLACEHMRRQLLARGHIDLAQRMHQVELNLAE
jgi:hypothetical protein